MKLLLAIGLLGISVGFGCGSPSSTGDASGPGDAAGSGTCQGCLLGGACVDGTANAACGRGGAACTACTSAETCEDRTCLAPASCDATTCPMGCCDDNDTCQSGTTLAACGVGGERCETCPSGSCTGGACDVACDASTCNGCCNAQGQCVTTPTSAQCGRNGEACEACATGLSCSAGVCANTSCIATCDGCCTGSTCNETSEFDSASCGNAGDVCRVCGPAFICTNGDCVPDNLTRWDLVVLSGTVATTKPNGDSWDAFGGLPDPKLCTTTQNATEAPECTPAVSNTLMPVWNAVMMANASPSHIYGNFFWDMYDSDPTFDDGMGVCIHNFANTDGDAIYDGNVHTFECNPAHASGNGFYTHWTVRYKLVRKQ